MLKPKRFYKVQTAVVVLALILFNSAFAFGQKEFKVLMVKPSTVFINEKPLQIGDVFQETDLLFFSDNHALLKVCFGNCSQTRVLIGYTFYESKAASLKDYLITTKGLSTRGELNNECISFEELNNYSQIGIIGELVVCFDSNLYLLDTHNNFVLQYTLDKQITYCKIPNSQTQLTLDASVLDTVSLKTDTDKFYVNLVYHSGKEDMDFLKIKNLQITYINPVILSSELRLILNDVAVELADKQEIIRSYLAIFFPDIEILQMPLDKLILKM